MKKKVTSAGANKWLRSLEDEKNYILSMENEAKEYIIADGEKVEPPIYDYEQTEEKLQALDSQIRRIKHAINIFNTTTLLPELQITVDEALVMMAQLNKRREKLDAMRKRLPKTRNVDGYRLNMIEYIYLNYDLEKVQKEYQKILDKVNQIQLELDLCNQTKTFEVEID